MSVTIPDEILEACGMTAAEFKQEIAIMLFQSGKLTLGYASKLAQMDRGARYSAVQRRSLLALRQFQELLKERNIPLYFYDVEDFELDLKNLRELGRL